ncbi:uncharacterized protein LOC111132735 [Crassostrea virginica]
MQKLHNLKGKLLKSVQPKSGNVPADVATTQSGDLVYSDYHDRSTNLVSGTQIHTLIKLRGWKPLGLCIAYFGSLLVIKASDDGKQTKVVCHSHSMEQHSIQWDDQADAVVVVSAAGILRFMYTGPPSTHRESSRPYGITTDPDV